MTLIKRIQKGARQIAKWNQFEKKIRPEKSFNHSYLPKPPNYSKLSNWVAHPNKASKVHFTPEGTAASDAWKSGQVDVFFLYPTLFFGHNNWNAALDHQKTNHLAAEMIMTGQASVFNSCCRILAPRYRQATFYSFLGAGRSGQLALELAYQDCLAAFDFYIENFNNGRPFFLAGHSQGALHIMRLLDDRIEDSELAKKLVAAYPVGFWFPIDKFDKTLKTIHAARNATDTGCVVAYDTYLEGGRPLRLLDRAEVVYGKNGKAKWEKRRKKTPFGVNPLSWNSKPMLVSEKQHLGAVQLKFPVNQHANWSSFFSEEDININCIGLSQPYPEECTARVGEDGLLYVSSPRTRAFKNLLLPGGNLHLFDYSLFYMNLRKNIQERWESYQNK